MLWDIMNDGAPHEMSVLLVSPRFYNADPSWGWCRCLGVGVARGVDHNAHRHALRHREPRHACRHERFHAIRLNGGRGDGVEEAPNYRGRSCRARTSRTGMILQSPLSPDTPCPIAHPRIPPTATPIASPAAPTSPLSSVSKFLAVYPKTAAPISAPYTDPQRLAESGRQYSNDSIRSHGKNSGLCRRASKRPSSRDSQNLPSIMVGGGGPIPTRTRVPGSTRSNSWASRRDPDSANVCTPIVNAAARA